MSRAATKFPSNAASSEAAISSTASPKSSGRGIPTPHIAQEVIAQRAFEKYVARGCQPGLEQQDWFEAEQELLAEAGKKQRR